MATAEPAAKEPTATAEPAMAEPVMTADVSVSFALGELNSSGQSGAATLTANGDSTVVTLQLSGGDLETELVHIHNGQCGDSLAGVAHALTNFADGAGTSVTTIDASLDSLLAGTFAINAHQSGNPETYTACGNVLVGGGETSAQASLEADIRRFTLPALTIAVGTTVQWTNQDRTTHTVTLGSNGVGDEGGFESGNLGGGGTFEFTFDTTGSFAYTCRIHPSMNAIIEVTDGSSSPGVPSIGVVHPRP
jgi:plastocyanin